MNRFAAKLVHWSARLAFWHKSVEVAPEQPESRDAETTRNIEAESSAAADVPVLKVGWFARLKQVLQRRRNPDQEPCPDPGQAVVMERASPEPSDTNATVGEVPAQKLSCLARIKNKLRRQPKLEQLEGDAKTSKPTAEKNKQATASGDVDSSGKGDAAYVSRNRQVLALLSNKWVWMSSISVVLLTIIVMLLLMLLQSAREKEQLQVELLSAQKKLGQTTRSKQAAVIQDTPKPAGDSSMEIVGSAADNKQVVNAEDCFVTDKKSVTQNLKNCIDSFNKSMSN